jgi:hypothetical protein
MAEATPLEALTFATSLERLGAELAVKVIQDNLRVPTETTDPSARVQAVQVLIHTECIIT